MTDIVLRDIDPGLADRIRRISEMRGWSLPETLLQLLEHGLHACDGRGAPSLDPREAGALEAAIIAMEQVPNDDGFALIGRATPEIAVREEPDQHIVANFSLE